ncbi:DUF4199 domain-containing protein [Parapedobacter sp. DT-150]|uniref:DUF4199 domain-containing protein n=1 Tax=Parapedobacter sp. DT-150 TaxID=3396162 RepID=UPI003F199A2B
MMNVIRYGVFLALAMLLWAVAEWLVGLHGPYIRYHEYLSYFFAVPSVAILYGGIRSAANRLGGHMDFRKAFMEGLGITLVATLLCPLVWYVFCVGINPAFLANMTRFSIDVKGMDAQLAAQLFSLPNHLLLSTLSMAVVGTVTSLVVAIIVARRSG